MSWTTFRGGNIVDSWLLHSAETFLNNFTPLPIPHSSFRLFLSRIFYSVFNFFFWRIDIPLDRLRHVQWVVLERWWFTIFSFRPALDLFNWAFRFHLHQSLLFCFYFELLVRRFRILRLLIEFFWPICRKNTVAHLMFKMRIFRNELFKQLLVRNILSWLMSLECRLRLRNLSVALNWDIGLIWLLFLTLYHELISKIFGFKPCTLWKMGSWRGL